MSGEFKKFIETGGKSRDEIKRSIEMLLRKSAKKAAEDVVEDYTKNEREAVRKKIAEVLEDARQSAAPCPPEKIPPRERDNIFYRKPEQPAALSADEIAYAPEAMSEFQSPEDAAINERIAEMRSRGEIFYNGYLVRRCAEISIVTQGEFMADVTDDFGRRAFCGITRPIYGALSNAQLRTYFTWRTDVRRGVYRETDKPYITLYCYELLNKVGCVSSADAFSRLLALWEGCKEFAGWLDGVMPRWLKDFYAYNDITAQYPDVSDCLIRGGSAGDPVIAELYSKQYENKLDYLMDNSSYNLKGSVFFSDETRPLLEGAAGAVMTRLDGYFSERGVSLFELICGKLKKDYSWTPFAGAYVNLDRMDGFRAVRISSVERYCLKRGEPSLECFEAAPYRGFIGYVLKSTEAVLRKRTGFRAVTPNINTALNDFKNREKLIAAISSGEFESAISDAANAWCAERGIAPQKKSRVETKSVIAEVTAEPAEVDIDISKLSRIREESDELAKRLIVEEAPSEQTALDISRRVADEDFSERIAGFADLADLDDFDNIDDIDDIDNEAPISAPAGTADSSVFAALPEEWRRLGEALDDTLMNVLAALFHGNAAEFCRERGLLPEAVYEEINGAALECIGDVVIENAEVVEDYKAELSALLTAAGAI